LPCAMNQEADPLDIHCSELSDGSEKTPLQVCVAVSWRSAVKVRIVFRLSPKDLSILFFLF
jgi:hypothetical protein